MLTPVPGEKRILVTGGCGFIGGHLVAKLVGQGYQVTVLDDLSLGSLNNLPHHPNIDFVKGSVLNPHDVKLASKDVAFIFHLASIVGMKWATADPELTYRVSVLGTHNVLRYSPGIPFVLFSSSAVYGLHTQGSAFEDAVRDMTPALAYDGGRRGYAGGKWQAEMVAKRGSRNHRPVLIVRPFNTVGPRQTAESGMVIPRLVSQALSAKPLSVFGDGRQVRCFSDVATVINSVVGLASTPEAWTNGCRAVNVGTRQSTSILELCRVVLEECGSNSPMEYHPYEAVFPGKKDVQMRVPDQSRLTDLIGPVEWPTIQTIVNRYVDFVQRVSQTCGSPS